MIKIDGNAKTAEFRAVVTRADGSVEDLGRIAYWHVNPVKCWIGNAVLKLKGKFHGRSRPE